MNTQRPGLVPGRFVLLVCTAHDRRDPPRRFRRYPGHYPHLCACRRARHRLVRARRRRTKPRWRGAWPELLDGGFPYLAAEVDGRLAGYAYAALYRDAAGLPLHRRGFGLCRARHASPRRRPGAARCADRSGDGARLPADDRGDRRLDQTGGFDRRCTRPPDSAMSAFCKMSASSTAAGSTAC